MPLTIESIAGISTASILAGTVVPVSPSHMIKDVLISDGVKVNDQGGDVYALVFLATTQIPLAPPPGTPGIPFTPPAPVGGRISGTIPAVPGATIGAKNQLAVWANWKSTSGIVTSVGPAILPFQG